MILLKICVHNIAIPWFVYLNCMIPYWLSRYNFVFTCSLYYYWNFTWIDLYGSEVWFMAIIPSQIPLRLSIMFDNIFTIPLSEKTILQYHKTKVLLMCPIVHLCISYKLITNCVTCPLYTIQYSVILIL